MKKLLIKIGFVNCTHENKQSVYHIFGIEFWHCPDCGHDNFRDR